MNTSHVTHAEGAQGAGAQASLYVPRIVQQHIAADPDVSWWESDGTAVFSDVSGFTRLSERLARKGREGSEIITDVIGRCFESILAVAYDNGASLLKFGGDALLLWFQDEGHAARACRAAVLMRRVLRDVGRIEVPGARVTLRMSQGIHTGRFHFFMAGTTHRELLPLGPAWSRVVTMEHGADAGQILVSPETAAQLPVRCVGAAKGPGRLAAREPPGTRARMPFIARPEVAPALLERCLPTAVRAHVQDGGGAPEHRPVTIAFLRIEGTDALIAERGPAAVAELLHRMVSVVEEATEAQGVALLASDVDVDGGKLILTAGAPRVTGDDEERMLLALRAIVASAGPLALRIGVNRGAIFAGDIGPFYRRTYTVMGDAVNLAARLMAKAPPGAIYATADVLDRSDTVFATTALEPFLVKGKAKPVEAWDVGKAVGSRTRHGTLQALPLTGRDAEIATLREALTAARSGSGHVFELVGEAGVGKSRLASALREEATDFHRLHAVCEAYTASTPYAVWQELLRELVGIGRGESDDTVALYVREIVTGLAPSLLPWLPLVAIAFGVEVPSTPEVDMLAENNRRPKLHEAIVEFLATNLPGATLIEFENAHHMDVASSELLAYIAQAVAARPWVIVSSRRPAEGSEAPARGITRIELAPLESADALRLAKSAAERHPLPSHVLQVVAQRSGGNPQFLRDLMRVAIESGGTSGLPDSAEAAAMARIDALTPGDRAILRRAAVFGLTFHPRMLEWLGSGDGTDATDAAVWRRLHEFFDDEGDGYLRFRRALMRDAAYQSLPFKLRRQFHRTAAQRLEGESENPEDVAGILSLHYFEAGDFEPAWRFAPIAAKRAEAAFAYVEAAGLYARAMDAAKRLTDTPRPDLARVCRSLGESWLRAAEYQKASGAFVLARRVNAEADPVLESVLLLFQSRVEEKLGQYAKALRWAARARRPLDGRSDAVALRQLARSNAWYATVLQFAGRPREAVRCAERAVSQALPIEDHDALADAYLVIGWARGAQGLEGAEHYWKLALESAERARRYSLRPALLINLGLACQWKGRWDEAIEYYEQGRDESVRIGSNVNAMLARLNIAEILIDRSEWTKASDLLRETLPFFKAARYRFFLAACLVLMGRLYLGMGRRDDAFEQLQASKRTFVEIGAADEIPGVDARLAQCLVYQGNADAAIALADAVLARVAESNAIAKLVPLLQRVRALALYTKGDDAGALAAAQSSLAAATDPKDAFEFALTSYFVMEFDRAAGRTPRPEIVAQAESLLAKFGVREVPVMPEVVAPA